MAEKQKRFIQIGTAALRNPATGEFYPSFPLYMKADDEVIASREKAMQGIGRIFADKFRQYVDGCEEAGITL